VGVRRDEKRAIDEIGGTRYEKKFNKKGISTMSGRELYGEKSRLLERKATVCWQSVQLRIP